MDVDGGSQGGESGQEGAPVQGGAGAAEGSLRERILEYIRGQLGGAEQEVLLSTKMIADALGTSANNVTYHVGRLVHAGHISTRSAGPQGTRFRLGGTPPAPAAERRRRAQRTPAPRVAVAAPEAPAVPVAARGTTNFCPYCGSKVLAEDWRFCATCGKPLGR